MSSCESLFVAVVNDPTPTILDQLFETGFRDFERIANIVFFKNENYMRMVGMEPPDLLSELYLCLFPCLLKWIQLATTAGYSKKTVSSFRDFLGFCSGYVFREIRDKNAKRIGWKNGSSYGRDPLYSVKTASLSGLGDTSESEDDNYGYDSLCVDPTAEQSIKNVDESIYQNYASDTLMKAMASIPEVESVCIKHIYYDAKSMQETADIMHLDVETVRINVRSGLLRMRSMKDVREAYLDLD